MMDLLALQLGLSAVLVLGHFAAILHNRTRRGDQ
jgi:hypothetical protein